MALDVQRNWDVAMAKNLQKLTFTQQDAADKRHHAASTRGQTVNRSGVLLPDELIVQTLRHLEQSPDNQRALWSCCLLSRQWYSIAVEFVYARPFISGRNFEPFVRTICPSINLHVRKSPLSHLVRTLDLSLLVHSASRSTTARLLGRCKDRLEVFVAPQASFALNCLAALAKCTNLRILDLSLISESIPHDSLFHSIQNLQKLSKMFFPRSWSSGASNMEKEVTFPPALRAMHLSGSAATYLARTPFTAPPQLHYLDISHCPSVPGARLYTLLAKLGQSLESLVIRDTQDYSHIVFKDVLLLCPSLRKLQLDVLGFQHNHDMAWDDTTLRHSIPELKGIPRPPQDHPLQHLVVTLGHEIDRAPYKPYDVLDAIERIPLPHLRVVEVSRRLLWQETLRTQMEDLQDALEETEMRDWEIEERGPGSDDVVAAIPYEDLYDKWFERANREGKAGVYLTNP